MKERENHVHRFVWAFHKKKNSFLLTQKIIMPYKWKKNIFDYIVKKYCMAAVFYAFIITKKTLFYEWTETKIFIKMSDYSQSTIKSHLFAMCFNPFHIIFLNRILKVLFCGIEERHKHLLCSLRSNVKKVSSGSGGMEGIFT